MALPLYRTDIDMLSRVVLFLFLLAVCSLAQSVNTTFVTGLGQYLQGLGLHSVTQVISSAVSDPGAQSFFQNIDGISKTFLAPTDAAFTGLTASAATNTTLLAERLSYHLLSGTFTADVFSPAPDHTIARTYFTDPSLEGNKAQVLAFSNDDGVNQVLNQNSVVTIVKPFKYENLLIYTVDAVLDVPGTITAAFATWNLTALPAVLNTLGYTDSILGAHGLTVFAPTDGAFAKAASQLQATSANPVAVKEVMANHVVNGTSVYSSLFGSAAFTSAAGNVFSFFANSSGTYVTSGDVTAQIIQSDIIVQNGVLHIIDTVLYSDQSDPAAASSAYNAATSSAGQASQETGAIGSGLAPPSAPGFGGKQPPKSAAITQDGKLAVQVAVASVGLLGGAALLV